MAKNKAEIVWTSDDAALLRTLQKVETGFDEISRRMQRVENQGKKTTKATETGFQQVGNAIAKTSLALIGGGSLLTAIDMVRDANRKMIEEAQEANKEYDKLFRSFRVQAGLGELEGAQAKTRILAQAERAAVPEAIAVAGAKGLIGAGFSTQDATGSALAVLLRTQAAFNVAGKAPADAESLAKAAAAYLTSQGTQTTAGNVERAMQEAFALRAGAFELSDFAEMAKHGAVFAGKLTQQEQLAAMGTLVDVMPAAEAGTSLRNIVSRLATARVGRTSGKALKQIGMTAADVDLVGENFGTVLERLSAGLAGIPEAERAGVLKQLFEEAGVAPASTLLAERTGKYQRYQAGMATSGAEFRSAAAIAQSGREATATRLGIGLRQQQAAQDVADDLVLQAIEAEQREAGVGGVGRMLSRQGFGLLRSLGISQEGAITMAAPITRGRGTAEYVADVYGRIGAASGGDPGSEALRDAIERNTEATKENTRKSGGEEPRVSPPAGSALRR